MLFSHIEIHQTQRYGAFYNRLEALSRPMRFDIRYRARRLQEVLAALRVDPAGRRILDFGFGGGELLLSFPSSCSVVGVDVSSSAVQRARDNAAFRRFRAARFATIDEGDATAIPGGPFDIAISAHTLEHVIDDRQVLEALYERLVPGGALAVFVPIEEPDYVFFHLRSYSLQSITERVMQAGFTIYHVEGSMFVNGHIWKFLTIPSRRRWPLLATVCDAMRVLSLAMLPYLALRAADELLYRLGFGARQALVIAKRPG
jgi:2-polyprenyl-3-methyl-5-hydroxy-6-metoxy-1,4-benzoquinol methylase